MIPSYYKVFFSPFRSGCVSLTLFFVLLAAGNENGPFRFPSANNGQTQPVSQSFQQINFFGPLSPQQQRQQQDFRSGGSNNNPFFIQQQPASTLRPFLINNSNVPPTQRPQQQQQPNFGNRSPLDNFTPSRAVPVFQPATQQPANTFRPQPEGIPPALTQRPAQFQPSQPIEQSGTARDQPLPVPLSLRTTTTRPLIQPTEPSLEDALSVEAMLSLSPDGPSDSVFQRVRPTNVPAATVRPIQLQILSDQPEDTRDARLLRNRQRGRPVEVAAGSSAEQQGRRVPPTANINTPLAEDKDSSFVPSRVRNRFSSVGLPVTTTTIAEEEGSQDLVSTTATTTEASDSPITLRSRPQQPVVRVRTTTPRLEVDDNSAAVITSQFGNSPPVRVRLPNQQQRGRPSVSTTPKAQEAGNQEQPSLIRPDSPESTTSSATKDAQQDTNNVLVSSSDHSTAQPLSEDLKTAVSSETDSAGIEEEEEVALSSTEYYDDEEEVSEENLSLASNETSPPSTSKESRKSPDDDNDHLNVSSPAHPVSEEEEHPPAPPSGGTGRPTKLEILGRNNNTSSVKLDNVVFVPNLDGLLLPQSPRSTTSAAPSQSVTTTAKPTVETEEPVSQQPVQSLQSDRQSKAIDGRTGQLLVNQPVESVVDDGKGTLVDDEGESTIDELDRFQSELSSKHLTNTFQAEADKPGTAAPTPPPPLPSSSSRPPLRSFERPRRPFDFLGNQRPTATTTVVVSSTTPRWEEEASEEEAEQASAASSSTTETPSESSTATTTNTASTTTSTANPVVEVETTSTTTEASLFERLFGKTLVIKDDISSLLPPGFKPEPEPESPPEVDMTALLPPGFKAQSEPETRPEVDISALLPPGFNVQQEEDISSLLPPGFKTQSEPEPPPEVDISSLLPPGFKLPADSESSSTTNSSTTKEPEGPPVMDISSLLPPDFKPDETSTPKKGLLDSIVFDDLSVALLPPDFKHHLFTPSPKKADSTPETSTPSSSSSDSVSPAGPVGPDGAAGEPVQSSTEGTTTTTNKKGLVFPTRASPARNVTTEKPRAKPTLPTVEIKSGWPVR